MSIKLAVLQTGDQIIADMRELMDGEKSVAYLFKKPQKIVINSPLLVEDDAETAAIEVSLSSWILLTDEDEIMIPINQVVTLVEPVESVVKMYLEKMSYGQNDQSDPTD
jgi:transcriptional/translational regulatory protein YebC/TACO1